MAKRVLELKMRAHRVLACVLLAFPLSACSNEASAPWDRFFYLREWETFMVGSIEEERKDNLEAAIKKAQAACDNSNYLAPDHHRPVSTLQLANLYLKSGDKKGARKNFVETVKDANLLIKENDSRVLKKLLFETRAGAYKGLAFLAFEKKNFKSGSARLLKAIKDLKEAQKLNNFSLEDRFLMQKLADTLASLALSYKIQNHYHESALIYSEAIMLSHIALVPQKKINNLISILDELRRSTNLTIDTSILSKKPPWIESLIKARQNLKMKNYSRAVSLCQRAIDLAKNKKLDSVFMAFAYDNLGKSQLFAHNNSKSMKAYQKALLYRESFFDKHNPGIEWTLNQISIAATRAGDYKIAEKSLSRIVKLREEQHGHAGVRVAKPLVKLGELYLEMKAIDKASLVASKAYKILLSGENYKKEPKTLSRLAELEFKLTNYKQANKLYRKFYQVATTSTHTHYREIVPLFQYQALLSHLSEQEMNNAVLSLARKNLKNLSNKHLYLVIRDLSQLSDWMMTRDRKMEARSLCESVILVAESRSMNFKLSPQILELKRNARAKLLNLDI